MRKLFPVIGGIVLTCFIVQAQTTNVIRIDTRSSGRVFEGIGGVSAGASSRLLIDYPEPYRSQVLDYLFKPNYGAGFQHLKVEVGGPSHARTLDEFMNPKPEYFQRGYEWWLMKEAVARDSSIILDCLQWGAPDWVRKEQGKSSLCSGQNADYLISFIKGGRQYHGLNIGLVGIWNETPYDVEYIKLLRKALDINNLGNVKIVGGDQPGHWQIAKEMNNDPELAKSVAFVSSHYPGYLNYLMNYLRFDAFDKAPEPSFSSTSKEAMECGKPLWAGEHGPWRDDWKGACELARIYNRSYIDGKVTKTEIWALLTGYYDILPLPKSGVMRANTPWSGNYEVCPTVWTTAHTTQFARPGWRYLDPACGYLSGGGSFVTLLSPDKKDFSIIIETVDAVRDQKIDISIPQKMKVEKLHVWQTSDKNDPSKWFRKTLELVPVDRGISLTLEPGSVYSITTTTGQHKGDAVPSQVEAFPFPYREDFSGYIAGTAPKYFSDQVGAFEIATDPAEARPFLHQIITSAGVPWGAETNEPYTLVGDACWDDYQVSINCFIEDSAEVRLYGRAKTGGWGKDEQPESYFLRVKPNSTWELCKVFNRNTDGPDANAELKIPIKTFIVVMDSGKSDSMQVKPRTWFRMGLNFSGNHIIALINDTQISNFFDNNASRKGMVGLGTGWGKVRFSDLNINSR
jgi:hypothetical protein